MNRRRFVAALGAALLLPSAVAAKKKPTPPANVPSRGLGITGKEWKQYYGKPDSTKFGRYTYKMDGYDIWLYVLDDDAQMQMIDFQFKQPTPAEDAGFEVGLYLPTDAEQLEQTRLSDIELSILWHSDWLATSQRNPLPSVDLWPNANPGDYITILNGSGPNVTSVVVGLGNNP